MTCTKEKGQEVARGNMLYISTLLVYLCLKKDQAVIVE